jgi:hypothetical protein
MALIQIWYLLILKICPFPLVTLPTSKQKIVEIQLEEEEGGKIVCTIWHKVLT